MITIDSRSNLNSTNYNLCTKQSNRPKIKRVKFSSTKDCLEKSSSSMICRLSSNFSGLTLKNKKESFKNTYPPLESTEKNNLKYSWSISYGF